MQFIGDGEIHVEGKFQMIKILKQELIKMKELQEWEKKIIPNPSRVQVIRAKK